MDAASTLWSIITFIVGLLVFVAILSIEVHTRKSNQLLRKLLEEQNPERFTTTPTGAKLFDSKTGKKI